MTVVVTRKPGGVTQLFNTETGRVTYKCKAESAFMLIEAFGGIVKFNQKEAKLFRGKIREGSIVVDVGANIGVYSLMFANINCEWCQCESCTCKKEA